MLLAEKQLVFDQQRRSFPWSFLSELLFWWQKQVNFLCVGSICTVHNSKAWEDFITSRQIKEEALGLPRTSYSFLFLLLESGMHCRKGVTKYWSVFQSPEMGPGLCQAQERLSRLPQWSVAETTENQSAPVCRYPVGCVKCGAEPWVLQPRGLLILTVWHSLDNHSHNSFKRLLSPQSFSQEG